MMVVMMKDEMVIMTSEIIGVVEVVLKKVVVVNVKE